MHIAHCNWIYIFVYEIWPEILMNTHHTPSTNWHIAKYVAWSISKTHEWRIQQSKLTVVVYDILGIYFVRVRLNLHACATTQNAKILFHANHIWLIKNENEINFVLCVCVTGSKCVQIVKAW